MEYVYITLEGRHTRYVSKEAYTAAVLGDFPKPSTIRHVSTRDQRWDACARVHACEHRVKALHAHGLTVPSWLQPTESDLADRWS